jgi:hypothetical protein
VLSSFISIIASGLTVLSRLHDLRLTRHTVWIRKKSYDDFNGLEYKDHYIDIDNYDFYYQFQNFITTICYRKYFIKVPEIADKEAAIKKFSELRLRNLLLSRFSWQMINLQFIMLTISLVLYFLSGVI